MATSIERQSKYIKKQKEKNNKRVSFFISNKTWKRFKRYQSNSNIEDFIKELLKLYLKNEQDLKDEQEFYAGLKKEEEENIEDFLKENTQFIGDPFFDEIMS